MKTFVVPMPYARDAMPQGPRAKPPERIEDCGHGGGAQENPRVFDDVFLFSPGPITWK